MWIYRYCSTYIHTSQTEGRGRAYLPTSAKRQIFSDQLQDVLYPTYMYVKYSLHAVCMQRGGGEAEFIKIHATSSITPEAVFCKLQQSESTVIPGSLQTTRPSKLQFLSLDVVSDRCSRYLPTYSCILWIIRIKFRLCFNCKHQTKTTFIVFLYI